MPIYAEIAEQSAERDFFAETYAWNLHFCFSKLRYSISHKKHHHHHHAIVVVVVDYSHVPTNSNLACCVFVYVWQQDTDVQQTLFFKWLLVSIFAAFLRAWRKLKSEFGLHVVPRLGRSFAVISFFFFAPSSCSTRIQVIVGCECSFFLLRSYIFRRFHVTHKNAIWKSWLARIQRVLECGMLRSWKD